MFDKFGEFDSYEEINKAAEGQKAEGDFEALKELAEENGIDPEDVADYIDGGITQLCTPLTAAMGKIEIECKELKPQEIEVDWVNYIKGRAFEDEKIALAIRRKDKNIFDCIGRIGKEAYKNSWKPHERVMKAAGLPSNCKLGMPGSARVKMIIKDYYLEAK